MGKQESLLVQIYVASLIIMSAVVIFRFRTLPPQVPIFFTALEEGVVGPIWTLFILPIFSLLSMIVNIFLYKRFFNEDLFIRKVFYYSSVIVIGVSTYIFLKIILLIS